MSSLNSDSVRPNKPAGGFHWLDNELLDVYGRIIGANGYAIYGVLASKAWMAGGCCRRLAHSKIGAPLRLSVSTVRRTLKRLSDAGLIKVLYNDGDECDFLLLAIKKTPRPEASKPAEMLIDPGHREHTPPQTENAPVPIDHTNKEDKTSIQNIQKQNANPLGDQKRFTEVRTHIELSYQRYNQTDFCPWEIAEQRALFRVLLNNPKLATERAKLCVDNYFESVVNTAEYPRKWIPQLLRYLAGPLDEFKNPLYVTGERIRRSAAARY